VWTTWWTYTTCDYDSVGYSSKIHISDFYFFNRNLSSNIDRLTRDIESTRETTEKLRVLNPIGTEDDSSFTSMLTNAQV
jgi:hypothetical protein